MEKLSELKIAMSYRTAEDDIVKDFYVPCMKVSTLYRRAVGYFTIHGLAMAANGVANLAYRKGKMQLVASPHLSPEDAETLQNAVDDPDSVLLEIVHFWWTISIFVGQFPNIVHEKFWWTIPNPWTILPPATLFSQNI